MQIKGFQPLTLLDFPDKLACIIFTGGCNFACPYCHNPEMIDLADQTYPAVSEEKIWEFLDARVGKLDGVVVTGGEPTIWQDLPKFLSEIKKRNFAVKLDTNGTNPALLQQIFAEKLVDYVAMDIKASPENYAAVCGKTLEIEKIQKSIELIRNSSVPHEFRSTVLPKFHTGEEIAKMGVMVAGAEKWYLQNFRPQKCLDKNLENERSFSEVEMYELLRYAQISVPRAQIRE